MQTSDFDYHLPPELIAQHPPPSRGASRMLVLERAGGTITHRRFMDLPEYLQSGDMLALNDTRVIPARVLGRKEDTGGKVEVFFLNPRADGNWDVLIRASRRPSEGSGLLVGDEARVTVVHDGEQGRAVVRVDSPVPVLDLLARYGETPLPPYIARKEPCAEEQAEDRERYQTVYADQPGAVAAPTAGLHFTEELLARLKAGGVGTTFLTLHVGIGTFKPVTATRVKDHVMDAERFEVSAETATAINRARSKGGRLLAVGSTSVRVLESVADDQGRVQPGSGSTELFIYPPYKATVVDRILTNFHLPRSTLLMMMCALAGEDLVMKAYEEAVREKYRFYSYGDCMLIL